MHILSPRMRTVTFADLHHVPKIRLYFEMPYQYTHTQQKTGPKKRRRNSSQSNLQHSMSKSTFRFLQHKPGQQNLYMKKREEKLVRFRYSLSNYIYTCIESNDTVSLRAFTLNGEPDARHTSPALQGNRKPYQTF